MAVLANGKTDESTEVAASLTFSTRVSTTRSPNSSLRMSIALIYEGPSY